MDVMEPEHPRTSGPIERVRASSVGEARGRGADAWFAGPCAGPHFAHVRCSICQDWRFLARHMPKLEAWFHYRNLDVSTLKGLPSAGARRHKGVEEGPSRGACRYQESIQELRHCRDTFPASVSIPCRRARAR